MPDDDLKLLIEALAQGLGVDDEGSQKVVRKLIDETLKFRDKLLEDTGQTVTVEDVRVSLDALEQWLKGDRHPDSLSDVQRALTQIMADSITLFKE